MKRRKVVFDTSSLLGAALRVGSVPHGALMIAYRTATLCATAETLRELERVVLRPKFDRYLNAATREIFLATYKSYVELVPDTPLGTTWNTQLCRDSKDNKFLLAALQANAEILVSSDQDLLVLHPWNDIAILSPADFLAQFPTRVQDH